METIMLTSAESRSAVIRDANDAFRRSFVGGAILISAGVEALPPEFRKTLMQRVREFDAFNADNDPHEEHDFGEIRFDDDTFLFKIEYYDRDMAMHSPDPADSAVTTRVLHILRVEEY
jgi:hypothetical protein